jgi:hypothetical protein
MIVTAARKVKTVANKLKWINSNRQEEDGKPHRLNKAPVILQANELNLVPKSILIFPEVSTSKDTWK